MSLRPAIIVMEPDMPELLLVVEIRANVPEQESDDTELKSYMVGRSCPVGMLVTTEKVSVYRNRYKGYTPQSLDIIGGCPTSELIGALPQRALAEADLEDRVQNWLESLQNVTQRSWPASICDAMESSVLPVLWERIVRAGGPRWLRTG
jgi:hypothetical protein